MKRSTVLAVTSLLSLLFALVHLSDDISRGMSPGGLTNLPVALVAAVWLYATLVLVERRSGLAVILVLSLLISGVPVIHMTGRSGITGGAAAGSAGALFFAWTLLALGATAAFSVILSARGLWSLRRGQPK
jgi:hypothetical protein